jgi:hypothetical protein
VSPPRSRVFDGAHALYADDSTDPWPGDLAVLSGPYFCNFYRFNGVHWQWMFMR